MSSILLLREAFFACLALVYYLFTKNTSLAPGASVNVIVEAGSARNMKKCRDARGCSWNRCRIFCRTIRSFDNEDYDFDFDFYDEE